MVEVTGIGKTIVFMMAFGRMVKLLEKEYFYIVMAMRILVNGYMIKHMVLEITIMQMERVIKEPGLMINKMGLE